MNQDNSIAGKMQSISYLLNNDNFSLPLQEIQQTIIKLAIKPLYPIILIGGTNGKGSTCAYLTTILTHAGYKVGSFTSPHLFEYNERITINNKPVTDNELACSLSQVIQASTSNPGIFKAFTLASHLLFAKHKIDIAIVEVGIGGLNDVTNLFEPAISAITNISLDHCQILGSTLEEIGLQKAGIYRPHKLAFFAGINPPPSLINYAKQLNSKLMLIGQDFGYSQQEISWSFYNKKVRYYSLPIPSLRGQEQLQNASLALAILDELSNKFPVSLAQIKYGLLQVNLPGRFQVLPGTPQVVFDTAHNPEAVEKMLQNMLKLAFAKRSFAVFGIAKDKDWQKIIQLSHSSFDKWFLAPLQTPRGCEPQEIKDYLLSLGINPNAIKLIDNISLATKVAYHELTIADRLVCFGSFLTIDEAYTTIQKAR